MENPEDTLPPPSNDTTLPQPHVQVIGEVPVDIIPPVIKCVIDMPEEEREAHFKERGEEAYKRYLITKASGCYNRCPKTDWCKVEQEKKAKEQKEKDQQLETLRTRNVLLEQHGREMEAKMRKMEASMEKLASLVSQMMPK